ncbi:MAG: hypothetical protein L0H73_06215 [Nitrococcus sp.]|nr:hypothetical protein [Nitrococcus sp.]
MSIVDAAQHDRDAEIALAVPAGKDFGAGAATEFDAPVRIDTPTEWDYYRRGGILHYVLRELAKLDRAT